MLASLLLLSLQAPWIAAAPEDLPFDRAVARLEEAGLPVRVQVPEAGLILGRDRLEAVVPALEAAGWRVAAPDRSGAFLPLVWRRVQRERIGAGHPSTRLPLLPAVCGRPRPALPDALQLGTGGLPFGATPKDVSEFLLGRVAVAVFLLESDGSLEPQSEDWDPVETAQQLAGIVDGLDFWAARAGGWTTLLLRVVSPAATGYEPITHSSNDELLFTEDALARLGFSHSQPWLAHYLYMNQMRADLQADWACLYFVADSSNDSNGRFADGLFDYAYFGGPHVMTTSTHGGSGAGFTDTFAAHEFVHLFYAEDEYFGAQVPCNAESGYLAVENQNSAFGNCQLSIDCIMKDGYLPFTDACEFSLGQAGLADPDGDGIPRILDTRPKVQAAVRPARIVGRAVVRPRPNLNPWSWGHAITLNTIAQVGWRLDGGPWQAAVPLDGAFDSGLELFELPHPGPGPHRVEIAARNSSGNRSRIAVLDVP